jgi:hypothetical protein
MTLQYLVNTYGVEIQKILRAAESLVPAGDFIERLTFLDPHTTKNRLGPYSEW